MDSDFDIDFSEDESSDQGMKEKSFYDKIMEDATQAASILNIHPDVAFLCLQLVNFDLERLLSDYILDNTTFITRLNIKIDNLQKSQRMKRGESSETITCNICFDDFPGDKMLSLPCGHFFCESCWRDYIMSHTYTVGKVKNENEGQNKDGNEENNSSGSTDITFSTDVLKCMESGCKTVILPLDIKMICGEKDEEAYLQRFNSKSIDTAVLVKRCSNPRCNLLLNLDSIGPCGIVECKCGQWTCWKCGEKVHAPLHCQNVMKWKQKEKKNADVLWLTENTKQCPNCKIMIEKNEGCNHMTCQNCKYEFCWLCGHEWLTHLGNPYSCMSTKYQTTDFSSAKLKIDDISESDKKSAEKETTINKLDKETIINQKIKEELTESDEQREVRLMKLFYLNKTEAHKEKKFYKLLVNDLSQIFDNDLKSIKKILEIRDLGRRILKWSYPYEYFLDPNSVNLRIFKYLQLQLEIEMEKLCFQIHYTDRNKNKIEKAAKKVDLAINSLLKHVDEDRMKE